MEAIRPILWNNRTGSCCGQAMKKYAVALMCVLVAAGCSQLDFGLESDEPEWGAGYTAQLQPASQKSEATLEELLAAWDSQAEQPEGDYRIGPGDELQVAIFALEQPDQTTVLTRTVSSDGSITLPWVHGVAVRDMTVPQAEQAIRAAYAGRYLQNPQVTVTVTDYASSTVVVTGAVNKPGIYTLKRNRATLLECLSMAGGPTREAGPELTLVRRGALEAPDAGGPPPEGEGKAAIRINLRELLAGGNPLLNVPVSAGDVVTIAPRTQQYVHVLGYVRRPGAYRLDTMQKMDAMAAVALGGGLTNTARAANSFLIRRTPEGQRTIPIDLEKAARGEVPPLYMQAGDTLVVGTGLGGRFAEVVAPSMGASVSASASVAP